MVGGTHGRIRVAVGLGLCYNKTPVTRLACRCSSNTIGYFLTVSICICDIC